MMVGRVSTMLPQPPNTLLPRLFLATPRADLGGQGGPGPPMSNHVYPSMVCWTVLKTVDLCKCYIFKGVYIIHLQTFRPLFFFSGWRIRRHYGCKAAKKIKQTFPLLFYFYRRPPVIYNVGKWRSQYDVSPWYLPGILVKYAQAPLVDEWKDERPLLLTQALNWHGMKEAIRWHALKVQDRTAVSPSVSESAGSNTWLLNC